MPKRLFQKGRSGNPNGRPKGSINQGTALVRTFARDLLSDTSYTAYVRHRIMVGQAPPALELYFWQLEGGKPKESVEHSGEITLPVRVVDEFHSS